MALLAQLIEDGTGMPIDAYAEEKLFRPLDIESFEWIKGADGVPSAASGLRLTLPDLTKIGVMVAQGGVYEGVEVVPESWIQASLVPRVHRSTRIRTTDTFGISRSPAIRSSPSPWATEASG